MIIKDVERDGLQFDIDVFGRYHFIALAMRREMLAKATKTEREDYAKTWGINPDLPDIIFQPPLSKISPELDIIMSRPGDPAHSEYQVCTNKEINTGRVGSIYHSRWHFQAIISESILHITNHSRIALLGNDGWKFLI